MTGYNLTAISSNSTSIVGMFQGINDVLFLGWFGTLFLISFFMILFISFYFTINDTGKSLTASSFIIFVLAVFLKALSLIDSKTLYITLIASAATVIFTWKK